MQTSTATNPHNVLGNFTGQLRLRLDLKKGLPPEADTAQAFWSLYSDQILLFVQGLTPSTMGKIIAHAGSFREADGKTSLYEVVCNRGYLDMYDSGERLLVHLASLTLAAHLWDVLTR